MNSLNNSLNNSDYNSPIFEKFVIRKDYRVNTFDQNGREIEITDENPLKKEILDGDYLSGSIALTRDQGKKGWVHKVLHTGQNLHQYITKRSGDPYINHGIIILHQDGKKADIANTHPLNIANSVFDGIYTTKRDYLQDFDITELIVYRPIDSKTRELFCKITLQTAFVTEENFKSEASNQKVPFSIPGLIGSVFHNKKHETCGKYGKQPSNTILRNSADLIADLILKNQILNKSGKPQALFCASYVTSILQGSLIMDSLEKANPKSATNFTQNDQGKLLTRKELADKILNVLQAPNKQALNKDDDFAHTLWDAFWNNKILRVNFRYAMSSYIAKALDELCTPRFPINAQGQDFTVNYVPPKKISKLEKVVKWYELSLPLPSIIKKVFSLVSTFTLSMASGGLLLPFVFKVKDLSYKINQEKAAEKFFKEIVHKIEKKLITPPANHSIEIKSDTEAFNHIAEYVIQDGVIWHRSKKGKENRQWKPMYFDGWPVGAIPKKISADGANLSVIDDKGGLHYRKVIIEGRGKDEIEGKRFTRHLKQHPEINPGRGDTTTYVAVDKSEKINWKKDWYNFPFLHRIINVVSNKPFFFAGAISHRGRFNHGYTDAANKFHESIIGVTTFYEHDPMRQGIRKQDPWVPFWSDVFIPFPRSASKGFVASKLDPSGSTLLAIGYEIDKITQQGKLKLITNLCDIDTSGGNPLLKYAYFAEGKESEKDLRVLQDTVENEGWIEHPLPEDAASIYDQISIIQTGIGNEAREIRIAAKNNQGELGIFSKKSLDSHEWEFMPYPYIDPYSNELSKELNQIPINLSTVPNFEAIDANGNLLKTALLKDFDQNTYHSKLELSINNKIYELPIHKRLGWKTYAGKVHELFELVIPEKQKDDIIIDSFGGRRKIPLKMEFIEKEEKKVVRIIPKGKHPFIPDLIINVPE